MKKQSNDPIARATQALTDESARLQAELLRVSAALASLQGKTKAPTKRKPGERKKPHWTPKARKEAALRMKRYWAGRRKAEKK